MSHGVPNPDSQADRRVHERLPSHLATTCRPVSDTSTWMAWLADVSKTGARILLSRYFKAGALISMELKTADGGIVRNVVAQIVRCQQAEDGGWIAGCRFASPLSGGEVLAFSSADGGSPSDRRTAVRIPCDIETTCRSAIADESETRAVRLRTLAPGGADLESLHSFEPGMELLLEIPGVGEIHSRILRGKLADDAFRYGIEFHEQLSDEHMQIALGDQAE